MISHIIDMFKTPTAEVLAQKELEEAKRELLKAHTSEEFYRRMKEYNQDRVRRLTDTVQKGAK